MADELDDLPVLKKSANGGYEKVYSQGDDLPVLKKKGQGTPTESSQGIPVVSLTDSQVQSEPLAEQPTPLGEKSGVSEPIDLPSSYRTNVNNYKDLISGQKYNLLRGGKPITGTWNAEREEFIKDPLINVTPQEKKAEGILEKAMRVAPQTTSGLPLPTKTEIKPVKAVESEQDALSRASTEADLVKKEVGDKIVAIEALSNLPKVQQYAELQKQFNATTDPKQKAILQKKIDEVGVESPFKKDVTRIGTKEEVVYNGDLYAPKTAKLEEFTGKLVEPTSTTADIYNRIKEDSDYIQQATGELKSYSGLVNNMLIARLPEDKRQYLKSLEGSPLYEEELSKTLAQDKEISNIVPAVLHGLATKIEGLVEAGSTLGLNDYEAKLHLIANARKKEMFGKVAVTPEAKIAEGVAGMAPDLLFGAYWSPLMLASMGTTMTGDFMAQNVYEQYMNGASIDDIDLSKARAYSATSTATQMALMAGAGLISKGAPILGKTFGQKATNLLLDVGKEGVKGAAIFGVLGTEVQNQINKAYDMAADDKYLEHVVTMGAISSLFALKHGLGQTISLSKAKSNEIDNLSSYLPPAYTKGVIDNLVKEGKMSATNGEEVLTKLNEYRAIRNQIPVELDGAQMDKIYSIWQEKQKIQNLSKDASPEFKEVYKGKERDLDQKILIEARVPLSGEERAERNMLMQKQAEANPIDNARLKYLDKRWEAEKEGKEIAKKKEEEAKSEAQKITEPKTETQIEVEPTKGYSFEYKSENEIPSELKNVEPTVKSEINGKIRLTFTGKQLIDAGIGKDITKPKTETDAIQERSTEEILSRQREGVSQEGGERSGVGQSDKGKEVAREGEAQKVTDQLKDVESTAKALEKKDVSSLPRTAIGIEVIDEGTSGYGQREKRVKEKRFKVAIDGYGMITSQAFIENLVKAGRLGEEFLKKKSQRFTDGFYTEQVNKNSDLFPREFENKKEISEAYHKAKADGSNPELVKAVEDLLAKPTEKKAEILTENIEPTVESTSQIFDRAFEAIKQRKKMAERDKILDEYGDKADKAKFVFKNWDKIKESLKKRAKEYEIEFKGDC